MVIDGVNPEDLPQTLGYNGDGTLAYVQVVIPAISGSYAGGTYRQTFSYTAGVLTGISNWVKQ